jgi:hypothetical protein
LSERDGGTASASRGLPLEPDERAELDQLRAEVLELRGQARGRARRRLGWHGPVATVLIVPAPAISSALDGFIHGQVHKIVR